MSNTRGSANTIEEAGQYFLEEWGERGEKGEDNHTTQPWTMSRSICGNSGGVGWLPGEGGSGTDLHTHRTWPGMHALHPLLSPG